MGPTSPWARTELPTANPGNFLSTWSCRLGWASWLSKAIQHQSWNVSSENKNWVLIKHKKGNYLKFEKIICQGSGCWNFRSTLAESSPPRFVHLPSGGSMVKNLPTVQRCGFNPWVRKIPWKRKWQPTPVFLPGKFHGQWSPTAYSP